MGHPSPEKFGTVGAVLAALACPICFPKVALVGAAVGLGVFAPYEGYIALAVQALFASFEFRVGKLGRLNGSRAAAGRAQPHP